MKSIYSKFLLLLVCVILGLNVSAQDAPVAGKKFRIANASGLYLTCDPAYNSGYNPWFIDSLYTVESSVSTDYVLNGETTTSVINSSPSQQTFTLVNPNPSDPEIWAIEAANGEYLAQSTEYGWDCVLSPSVDAAESQLYFVDQGGGIYFFQISTRSGDQYVASDSYTAGEMLGEYGDGWQYLYRSYIYNDKPSGQDGQTAYWWFEEVITTGINDVVANNKLNIFPSIARESLTINAKDGTRIAVYSITGQKIINTELNGSRLDVSRLVPGVYVVTTPEGERAKFIKQ